MSIAIFLYASQQQVRLKHFIIWLKITTKCITMPNLLLCYTPTLTPRLKNAWLWAQRSYHFTPKIMTENSFSLNVKGEKVINEVTVLSGQSQTKLIKWRALGWTGCWLLNFHMQRLQAVMFSLWDSSGGSNQRRTGLVCKFWIGGQISHTNGMNMVRKVYRAYTGTLNHCLSHSSVALTIGVFEGYCPQLTHLCAARKKLEPNPPCLWCYYIGCTPDCRS